MHHTQVSDINVVDTFVLPAPEYITRSIERTAEQAHFVANAREQLHRIIFGNDPRFLMILGPCSIHDVQAGREYAERIARLAEKVKDEIMLVMRVYFEKPRTTVGWKGLIMDPHLDGSGDIPYGLQLARRFLRDVIDLGVPTATELLDPITPQYIADLICWSAIGARTSESQTHRQMASGLSMPLGFKNTTAGHIKPAINAIKAASQPQTFLGISHQGLASAVTTRGNPNTHIILRGGDEGPNYCASEVARTVEMLKNAGLPEAVLIDCSHANSEKEPERQPEVLEAILEQAVDNKKIIGAMLESNLQGGKQMFPQPAEKLLYGQSITDGCIDWETTERIVIEAGRKLESRVHAKKV